MKDLIEEIEGLKQYETIIGKDDKNKIFITDRAYLVDDVIETLNQHNIITAPKSIKLSEVVSRLEETFKDLGSITYKSLRVLNRGFIYLDSDIVVNFDLINKKILNIEFNNTFIDLKWLYALWIANVEIIDDMEDKE